MIEHCISTLKSNREKKTYKVYVTDALMAIADNTTHYPGTQGMVDYGRTLSKRWIDMIDTPPEEEEKPEDTRPSDVIASEIWDRIRGHKS